MTTLYRFKSNAAFNGFMYNPGYEDNNLEMGKVLQRAGTFSLIPSNGTDGYDAFKDGVKLRTAKEGVYVTAHEMLKFFQVASEEDIVEEVKPEETEIDRFDKAVKLVSSVVDIDSRTEAFIKLVRYELANQGEQNV